LQVDFTSAGLARELRYGSGGRHQLIWGRAENLIGSRPEDSMSEE
jgi:hypothetical protein